MARPASGGPTVRGVAERAGVSPATVSRVINGARTVSAETTARVRRAIEELGGSAPPPRTGRRATERRVFLRCPYVLTDYFGFIVSRIVEELSHAGWRVELDAGNDAQNAHPLMSIAQRDDIAGAIVLLPTESAAEIAHVAARIPLVVLDPREALPAEIPTISVNHTLATRKLADHLIELGHRRIGLVTGPADWEVSAERRTGLRAALSRVGVLHDDELTWASADPTFEQGLVAAHDLLSLSDPPTALMCFNDKVATGALRAAFDRGLRVPEDLSITGFDDLDVGHVTRPTLTTVRQPLDEMGRMAVMLLATLIARRMPRTPQIELSAQVITRESTGPRR